MWEGLVSNGLSIICYHKSKKIIKQKFGWRWFEVYSLSEWWFITSIGTRLDWFQRTYVLISARKNL